MWKKCTSVFILILLVFHLAGSYVYFAVRLGEVRMTMREKLAELPDHQLEIVDVPLAAFQTEWLEEREMKWRGKMYDIARTETVGETVRVFCLHDEDEDGLLNFLSAVVETSQQDTHQAPGSVIQFFSLKYLGAETAVPVRTFYLLTEIHTAYKEHSTSFQPDPQSPPPRA